MLNKFLASFFVVVLSVSCFGNNPISKFEVQLSEEISFGTFYPIYNVTFEITPDSNFTITDIYFQLTSEDFELPIVDTWVMLNQSHLQCTHTYDSISGNYVFNFGMIELPPNYVCISKAKDINGLVYQEIEPF
jgi:hypothetical protein